MNIAQNTMLTEKDIADIQARIPRWVPDTRSEKNRTIVSGGNIYSLQMHNNIAATALLYGMGNVDYVLKVTEYLYDMIIKFPSRFIIESNFKHFVYLPTTINLSNFLRKDLVTSTVFGDYLPRATQEWVYNLSKHYKFAQMR